MNPEFFRARLISSPILFPNSTFPRPERGGGVSSPASTHPQLSPDAHQQLSDTPPDDVRVLARRHGTSVYSMGSPAAEPRAITMASSRGLSCEWPRLPVMRNRKTSHRNTTPVRSSMSSRRGTEKSSPSSRRDQSRGWKPGSPGTLIWRHLDPSSTL